MEDRFVCLDCGAPSSVTYISAKRTCQNCARARAVAQVDRAYAIAEALGLRTDDSLVTGIERSTVQITRTWKEAEARKVERKARRAEVKALTRKSAKPKP
jgi:hypothetical protein